MATKIEWVTNSDGTKGETWNPITGCTKVSEGCANCYAERMSKRLAGRYGYPADEPFRVTLHPDKLEQPMRWKKPRKIFVCSMSDLFHSAVPLEFQLKILKVIKQCPQHTFQILTKRPEQIAMLDYVGGIEFPPNVWLGISAENQQRADERIPELLKVTATVRFVSAEPLIGPLDLTHYLNGCPEPYGGGIHYVSHDMALDACEPEMEGMMIEEEPQWQQTMPELFWVIVGGESGPNARPMHPQWARDIRDQCQASGTQFFFKQHGEWCSLDQGCGLSIDDLDHKTQIRIIDRDYDKMPGYWPEAETMIRVGKKAAGRLLDGREWNEMPS